jgi:hypothetical protein
MLKTIIIVVELLWVMGYIHRVVIPGFAKKSAAVSLSDEDRDRSG